MRQTLAGQHRARVLFLGLMLPLACAQWPCAVAAAAQWNRQAAENSLIEARAMREALGSAPDAKRPDFLRCAEKYRQVYRYDPHYGGSDDAIFESGIVLQESGIRFTSLPDFRSAARQFEFLLSDYDRSPHRAAALLRLGDLYAGPLQDPAAATDKYDLLKSRYGRSKAAAEYTSRQTKTVPESVPLPAAHPGATDSPTVPATSEPATREQQAAPPEAKQTGPRTSVLNIRHWSTDDYTRVVIDMDRPTHFEKTLISDPDRLYFDIERARLTRDMLNRTFPVEDEFLKQVRVGQNSSEVVRVVLDFENIADHSVFELHDPFRLVVDIHGTRPNRGMARTGQNTARPDELAGTPRRSTPAQAAAAAPRAGAARPTPAPPKAGPPAPAGAEPAGTRTRASSAAAASPTPKEYASAPATTAPAGMSAETTERPAAAAPPPVPKSTATEPSVRTAEKAESASPKTRESPAGGSQAPAAGKTPQAASTATPAVSPVAATPAPPALSAPARTEAAAEAPAPSTAGPRPPERSASIPPPPPTSGERVAPPKVAPPTSRGSRTLTRVLGLKIGRIVLDPGHGGHDTGTIGRGGLLEKDLVLEVAHQLRKLIEDNVGAEVTMTREDDRFVALEERTAIANQQRADLFVSIHANSSSVRSASGVETYYLDFARTEQDRAVAARENASSVRNVSDLEEMIKRIIQADKSVESREFAATVQKRLFASLRPLFPAARNRGVRSAPFVVLIGANMPSILAEVAFISNPRDEKVLQTRNSKEQLARALSAGIEDYVKLLGVEATASRGR